MHKQAKVGVLYNPNSRSGAAWFDKQKKYANLDSVMVARTEKLSDVPARLEAFAKGGVTHLGVIGGDGTLDGVITHIRNHSSFAKEPVLAVFDAGTTNMSYKDVGFKARGSKQLARFINAAEKDHLATKSHQPLKVSSKSLSTPVYGFFMGMAAVPLAIHETRKKFHKKSISHGLSEGMTIAGAVWQLIRNNEMTDDSILSPVHTKITVGAQSHEADTILLTVTSLNRLLVGIHPPKGKNPMAIMAIFSPYSNFLGHLPALLFGTRQIPFKKDGEFASQRLDACELAFEGEWTLDGEMFKATKDKPLRLSAADPFTFATGISS